MTIHESPSLARQRYGLRVKHMREELHWTRDDVARLASVTFYDVRAIECGYEIDDEKHRRILECLEEALA